MTDTHAESETAEALTARKLDTSLIVKRPRGRPKGSKTKPKPLTMDQFLAAAPAHRIALTPPPKPAKAPKTRGCHMRNMTPEERSAHAKRMRAAVRKESLQRSGSRRAGVPSGWTVAAYNAAVSQAEAMADAMIARCRKEGWAIDPDTVEAFRELLTIIASPVSKPTQLTAIRTALEFAHAKPSQRKDAAERYPAETILARLAESPIGA